MDEDRTNKRGARRRMKFKLHFTYLDLTICNRIADGRRELGENANPAKINNARGRSWKRVPITSSAFKTQPRVPGAGDRWTGNGWSLYLPGFVVNVLDLSYLMYVSGHRRPLTRPACRQVLWCHRDILAPSVFMAGTTFRWAKSSLVTNTTT